MKKVDTREEIRVITANNFLRASGLEDITLKARKLLYLAMAQCRRSDQEFYEFTIAIQDFAEFMGVAPSNVYEVANKLTDELMRGFITFKPEGKRDFVKFNLFKKCEYHADTGITFQLQEAMTPILLNLKRDFTKPLLTDFARMRSNYSIEIWHLLQKEMKSRKPMFTEVIQVDVLLEELRKITGTQNKFKQLVEFKRYVWDKALREIRECCGVSITYTNIKQGRKVVGFRCSAVSISHIDESDLDPEFVARVKANAERIRQKRDQF